MGTNIKKGRIKITKIKIVFGCPCSGKSTFVRNSIEDNDMFFDYDKLMKSMSNAGPHERKNNIHKYIMSYRSLILKKLKNEENIDNVYIICSRITDKLIQDIEDLEVEYIFLEKEKEDVINQMMNDPDRIDKEYWEDRINEWFEWFEENKDNFSFISNSIQRREVRDMKNKKYWEFKNKSSTEVDLYLYIEIASWGGGYAAHSAQSFKQELDSLGSIDTLNIFINSPGGDVFEGNTIMNMLKRKKCKKIVYIDGLAASISSVIAMAGDEIIMPTNSMMMIHNAWTYAAGNSNDLRKLAEDLDKVNASIRQAYLDKAGDKLDEETLVTLMDNETWLTAQECYNYGLCDVVGEDKNIAAKFDLKLLNKYKNIPVDYVLNQAETKNNENQEIIKIKNSILEDLDYI